MAPATTVTPISPSQCLRTRPAKTSAPAGAAGARPDDVAGQLLKALGIPGLSYRARPTRLTAAAATYDLEFAPHADLATGLRGPLLLQVEPEASRARRAFAVQTFVRARGFPTPRPLVLVEGEDAFGGLLMERLPGRSALETLWNRPWRLWDLAGRMADLQVRLHQLAPDGFPSAGGELLDRGLHELRARVVAYGLEGLWPGLDWLAANRPSRTGTLRPLHLSWQPANLLADRDGLAALDWSRADVGDRHADVATTVLLLLCEPLGRPPGWRGPFLAPARGVLARNYLAAYRRRLSLDGPRLTYYSALAALQRLAGYGRQLAIGAGGKPARPGGRAYCATLCRYFARHTGVEVKLEREGW